MGMIRTVNKSAIQEFRSTYEPDPFEFIEEE